MGKKIETVYTCDVCGNNMTEHYHGAGIFHYMHVIKWWMPIFGNYKLTYLCPTCYMKLRKFLGEDMDGSGHIDEELVDDAVQ